MQGLLLQFLEPLVGPTNSIGRIRAVTGTFSEAAKPGITWLVVVISLLAILAFLGGFAFVYLRDQKKQMWQSFRKHADRVGLNEEERGLLRNVALAARLKNPDLVFASEDDFFRGLMQVQANEAGLTPNGAACGSCRYYESLRDKLGFHRLLPDHAENHTITLGPIKEGKTLTVIRQEAPQDFKVSVIAVKEDASAVKVEMESALPVRIGESWTLQYPEGGTLWEFTGRVVGLDSMQVLLKPVGELRYSERRRFSRAGLDKPARIALFPFEKEDTQARAPQFVPARLIEIAGPGLVLEANIATRMNDRVLIVLELNGRAVESVGVVRRVGAGERGPKIAVELVGLSPAQVADLSKETNNVSTGTKKIGQAGPSKAATPGENG